ncbi:MAG TPA: zinc-ribbon and DUF3426 domain-containing protein [Pseudomonadales bacterium]
MITAKCPKCNAQYQLTEEQLSIADGKVRCGACMTVFQAGPASAVEKAPAAEQPSPASQASRKPQRSSFVNQDDDRLINDTGVRQAFDKKVDLPTGEFNSLDDDELFGAEEPRPAIQKSGQDDLLFSDEFDQMLEEQGMGGGVVADDESWAEQLLAEQGESLDDDKATPAPQARQQPRTALGAHGDDLFDEDLDGLDISLSLTADEEEALGAFGKDNLRQRITPEPLELSLVSRRSLLVNLALALVALVALAGVAGQWFYFQFDELARDPQWRGLYARACQQLDCELPDQYRPEDVKASHLTVKSHPNYADSLLVEFLITNHADIDQPFPTLELFFTDMNQQVVAARSFVPSEYLRGEVSGAALMPPRQPIHLALEIVDPGKQATGYWIQLRY